MTAVSSPALVAQQKKAAARVSLCSNLTLLLLKLAVGLVSGSVSVLSEAAHSVSDLLASILTVFSVKMGDLPPDDTHPYGHGKVEGLSTLVQGGLLAGVACYIVYEAIEKLLRRAEPQHLGLGMGVMALSALVNVFVTRYVKQAARETDSLPLEAVSKDHQADIYAASGVLVGLVLVQITGRGFFDSLLALAVAALIFRSAWELFHEALALLLDAQLPASEVALVQQILQSEPSVLGYHKLRTRKSGSLRLVDAHILMDDHLTLLEAHNLTELVEDRIREALPHTEIILHTEPFEQEQRHQAEAHDRAEAEKLLQAQQL